MNDPLSLKLTALKKPSSTISRSRLTPLGDLGSRSRGRWAPRCAEKTSWNGAGKTNLVGGFSPPLWKIWYKYDIVSWGYDIPKIWKNKIHVPNRQPASVLLYNPWYDSPRWKDPGVRLRGISLREVILKHQKNGETWLIEVYVFLCHTDHAQGKKKQPFTARGPSS